MRVTEDKEFLTSLFPNVMKRTKLLILDHDVTRYHSFDLLRYQLFCDTQIGDKEHFLSIKPEFQFLLRHNIELAEKVRFMQYNVSQFNVYDCFNKSLGVTTNDLYTAKLQEMFHDPVARATQTDVGTRFDVVFGRQSIVGYLLRYTGDPIKPSCYDRLTVFEAENILSLETAVAIIKQEEINAVMICSIELAVRLATSLYAAGYKSPITFIIARYAYNFIRDDKGTLVYPILSEELGVLESSLGHEIGFFDPFSGLTYRANYIKEIEV